MVVHAGTLSVIIRILVKPHYKDVCQLCGCPESQYSKEIVRQSTKFFVIDAKSGFTIMLQGYADMWDG